MSPRTTILCVLLIPCWLAVGCPVTEPDDDSSDDDSAGDDDAGDDDTDPWYHDSTGLEEGSDPCQEPVLVEFDYPIDGDTAWVNMPQGGREKVRFIGVDTPELGYDGDPDECYGPESAAYTESRLAADRFWLTFDADCRDDYDRLLAYVHIRSGFFQIMQLEGGYATILAVEPNTTYAATFTDAQSTAQSMNAGLWGVCD